MKYIVVIILFVIIFIYILHIYGKNSIAIVQNKNNIVYGRYTIATRFIPAGTIINIESPIVTYKRNKPIKINYTDEQKQLIQDLFRQEQ